MEITITLAINLACGLIGGYFNLTLKDTKERIAHVVISALAASFMVPLFLEIGQSNVMEKITDNNLNNVDEHKLFFIYAGFCLIAAISSKTFITTITNKVLKDVEETKTSIENARQEQQAMKNLYLSDSAFQEEVEEEMIAPLTHEIRDKIHLDILDQFRSKLKFRKVDGLKKELNISNLKIKNGLEQLKEMELVDSVDIGQKVGWFLTLKGKKYLNKQ